MTTNKALKGLLVAAFLGSAISLSCGANSNDAPAKQKETPTSQQLRQQINMIVGVMAVTREFYIDPNRSNDSEELTVQMLKGALKSLDPHSDYMTQAEVDEMNRQSSGKFLGIGAELMMDKDKNVLIAAPMDGSPALKAGLQADDMIVEINNMSVRGIGLDPVVKKIRGEEGTDVHITVKRKDIVNPITFVITRAEIKASSVRTAAIGDIAYVRVIDFMQDGLAEEFRNAVMMQKSKMGGHPSGYIIDLRYNPGGRLGAAVNMTADLIGSHETIVSSRGKNPKDNGDLKADTRKGRTIANLTDGKKIVVLVNGRSASASEVMSGALQDLAPDRVTVMGTQTFGKGLVQTIMPLEMFAQQFAAMGIDNPKGAVKLTTAYYFSPKGRSIQNKGITPNVLFTPILSDAEKAEALEMEANAVTEAKLPSGLARPGDSAVDDTKTTASCTPKQNVAISQQFNRILMTRDGKPQPEILCALDKLRGTSIWTDIAPYTAPAKTPALGS